MRRRTRAVVLTMILAGAGPALGACGGGGSQQSAAHALASWVSTTGLGQSLGTLVADNTHIAQVAPNGSGALHGACATIVTDAASANSNLPAPDPTVTELLSQAYGLEGIAGNDCYDATGDPALLTKAERDGIKADALYGEALQRIRAVDGKPPATTTTAGNTGNSGVSGIFG